MALIEVYHDGDENDSSGKVGAKAYLDKEGQFARYTFPIGCLIKTMACFVFVCEWYFMEHLEAP